jgi:anti-sigma-K factor RskA
MAENHARFTELLPAYALDALDSGEIAALEAHLRTCKTCPRELEDYRGVSAGLLSALPPQAPPPALRRILQKRLMAETRPAGRWMKWSFGQVAMAGALALLICLNIVSIIQGRVLQQQQGELETESSSAQIAIAMLAYPTTQTITFDQSGISGSLLVDKKRDLLAIFAWHLTPAPAGKTYQVWLINSEGNRVSGGFLVPDPAYPFVTAVIKSPAALTGFTGFGVTTEPIGGSPAPTSPRIFGADF